VSAGTALPPQVHVVPRVPEEWEPDVGGGIRSRRPADALASVARVAGLTAAEDRVTRDEVEARFQRMALASLGLQA